MTPQSLPSKEDWAARECAHPDCDGWRMHSVEAVQQQDTTFVPACPICGPLPVVGSSSDPRTAQAMAADHNQSIPCAGECRAWFEDAA